MRSLFYSFLGYFLTPPGLVAMAALDSSLIFFLPLGIDFVVILLAARKPELFWLYACLATAGSLAGAAVTYWLGREIGEHGLSRLVRPSRLARIQQQVNVRGAYSLAALALIPPPFPFTAFVLTSGAFRVAPGRFFTMLGGVRLLRFGIEGALAAHYGRGIVGWMKSDIFQWFVGGFIVLAVVGTVISAIAIVRSTRRPRPSPGARHAEGSRSRT
jgi:membrane protein YqaA with SNARE-associated domain